MAQDMTVNQQESLFDKQNIPQLEKAVKREEKERDTKQKYLREVQMVLRKLMLSNSKNIATMTEKAMWNEAAQYQAYNYTKDARDVSSSSSEEIKYDYYEQSDDSDVKE